MILCARRVWAHITIDWTHIELFCMLNAVMFVCDTVDEQKNKQTICVLRRVVCLEVPRCNQTCSQPIPIPNETYYRKLTIFSDDDFFLFLHAREIHKQTNPTCKQSVSYNVKVFFFLFAFCFWFLFAIVPGEIVVFASILS